MMQWEQISMIVDVFIIQICYSEIKKRALRFHRSKKKKIVLGLTNDLGSNYDKRGLKSAELLALTCLH